MPPLQLLHLRTCHPESARTVALFGLIAAIPITIASVGTCLTARVYPDSSVFCCIIAIPVTIASQPVILYGCTQRVMFGCTVAIPEIIASKPGSDCMDVPRQFCLAVQLPSLQMLPQNLSYFMDVPRQFCLAVQLPSLQIVASKPVRHHGCTQTVASIGCITDISVTVLPHNVSAWRCNSFV